MPNAGEGVFGGMFGEKGGGISSLFGDRNFLSMLGGIGSRFSQGEGPGQAFGEPTREILAALSAQEGLKGAEAKREAFNKQFFDLLSGRFTPVGAPGLTQVKGNEKGLTIDLTPPAGGAGGSGPLQFESEGFSAGGGQPQVTPQVTGGQGTGLTSGPAPTGGRGTGGGGFKLTDFANF